MSDTIKLNYVGYYRSYKKPLFDDNSVYAICYHDYDLQRLSRPSINHASRAIKGLPETISLLDKNGYVLLTEYIQWAWYNWCKNRTSQAESENKKSFFSLTTSDRAWTNRYGSNAKGGFPACANYPCGTNLDKEPMRLFPLLSGGAYIKIIGGIGTNVLEFETMSSSEDLSKYNPLTHPYLFFKPTNSIREEIWWNKKTHEIVYKDDDGNYPEDSIWTGKYIENMVTPFPQFDENSIIPIIAREEKYNRIEAWKVKILPKGSPIPSPFVFK